MKRRFFLLLIVAIVTVLLCSCGVTTNESSNKETAIENTVDYKGIQQDMSNFMCENAYTVCDGWIYTMSFPKDGGQGILAKLRTDGSEYSVLTSKGAPTYIKVDGEFVYAVLWDDNTSKAYRCRLGGNDLKRLTKDNITFLQVTDDYLYYNKFNTTKEKTLGYYRSNKDGSNEELIYDKEIYYSFLVENLLYYQDDKDGETIHVYNLDTKDDKRITNTYSYGFVIDGTYIYYISNDNSVLKGDYNGNIAKLNLETGEETVLYKGVASSDILVKGKNIYFINANDDNRVYSIGKDGEGIKLISQDTNCMRLAIYGDSLMYSDFDSNYEYIDGIYICNLDGSNKVKISK